MLLFFSTPLTNKDDVVKLALEDNSVLYTSLQQLREKPQRKVAILPPERLPVTKIGA